MAGFFVDNGCMPELPEVETSRRGIAPHIAGETISSIIIRNRKLRWPVSMDVDEQLPGADDDPTIRKHVEYKEAKIR